MGQRDSETDAVGILGEIAKAAARSAPASEIKETIRRARKRIAALPLAADLDVELAVWESKADVILKDPAGRQGMARHAKFWAEKLRRESGS